MRVELKNIYKSFGQGPYVLEDITYSDKMDSLAIIGPSGGGKSTLLRIIAGLILPDQGSIQIDEDLLRTDEANLIAYRRKMGFVFQSNGLFHHLTGEDNIVKPLVKVHGYEKEKAKNAAYELLKRFDLMEHRHKYPHELSGGQCQRIAIARAVASKPKLVLFDEPTSSLDPELTADVLDMIHELKNDGLQIMLVTHEMGFAKKACEDVLFLSDGKLLEQGKSASVFENPKSDELKKFLNKILEWHA
ncbi:MAG TPA: glutamine ABC transporter ATP-binding protein [Eubacteriaceae bacterium]|nr:glutamine ABC transporter ATP-binding protein [Eubacteriaceae bacterium]